MGRNTLIAVAVDGAGQTTSVVRAVTVRRFTSPRFVARAPAEPRPHGAVRLQPERQARGAPTRSRPRRAARARSRSPPSAAPSRLDQARLAHAHVRVHVDRSLQDAEVSSRVRLGEVRRQRGDPLTPRRRPAPPAWASVLADAYRGSERPRRRRRVRPRRGHGARPERRRRQRHDRRPQRRARHALAEELGADFITTDVTQAATSRPRSITPPARRAADQRQLRRHRASA